MPVTPETSSGAQDPHRILRHNYGVLARRLGLRVGIFGFLMILPIILGKLGAPNSVWAAFPALPGVIGMFFTVRNFMGHPFRLRKCKKILSEYPLEPGSISNPGKPKHTPNKTFFTFDVTRVEDEEALQVIAVEPQGLSRWPKAAEDGVLIAGDLPFGGVVAVPGTNELLLMQPSDWHGTTPKRTGASPARTARAKEAGIEFWTL